jgi:hypothetical protein
MAEGNRVAGLLARIEKPLQSGMHAQGRGGIQMNDIPVPESQDLFCDNARIGSVIC